MSSDDGPPTQNTHAARRAQMRMDPITPPGEEQPQMENTASIEGSRLTSLLAAYIKELVGEEEERTIVRSEDTPSYGGSLQSMSTGAPEDFNSLGLDIHGGLGSIPEIPEDPKDTEQEQEQSYTTAPTSFGFAFTLSSLKGKGRKTYSLTPDKRSTSHGGRSEIPCSMQVDEEWSQLKE